MRCEHARDLAVLAAGGDLDLDEQASLDEHLDGCSACKHELLATERSLAAVSALSSQLDDLQVAVGTRGSARESALGRILLPAAIVLLVFSVLLHSGTLNLFTADEPLESEPASPPDPRLETPSPPQTLVRLQLDPATSSVVRLELGTLPPPRQVISSEQYAFRGQGAAARAYTEPTVASTDSGTRWIVLEIAPRRPLQANETVSVPSGLTADGRILPDVRIVRASSDESWQLCEISR